MFLARRHSVQNLRPGLEPHAPHTPLILLILLLRPTITGPQKPRGSPDQDPDQDQDHKAADAPTFKPTEVKRQNKMAAHAQAGAPFSSSCPCATISGISGISVAFFYGWGPALFACGLFLNATAMNRALVCEGRRKVNANANNGGLLQIARQLDTQLKIYNLS